MQLINSFVELVYFRTAPNRNQIRKLRNKKNMMNKWLQMIYSKKNQSKVYNNKQNLSKYLKE